MTRKRKLLILLNFILPFLLLFACRNFGVNPRSAPAFALNVKFNDNRAALAKRMLVDSVWVMVVDVSSLSENEFWQCDAWKNFSAIRDSVRYSNNSNYNKYFKRSGWEQFFSDEALSIVSNKALIMGPDSARGTVDGVAGLNWILIGFEEADTLRHFGQGIAVGTLDSTTTVNIYPEKWKEN